MDSQAIAREVLANQGYRLLIDGEWRATGRTFAVHNPATGDLLDKVANAGVAKTQNAIAAATRAFPAWAATPAPARATLLPKGRCSVPVFWRRDL